MQADIFEQPVGYLQHLGYKSIRVMDNVLGMSDELIIKLPHRKRLIKPKYFFKIFEKPPTTSKVINSASLKTNFPFEGLFEPSIKNWDDYFLNGPFLIYFVDINGIAKIYDGNMGEFRESYYFIPDFYPFIQTIKGQYTTVIYHTEKSENITYADKKYQKKYYNRNIYIGFPIEKNDDIFGAIILTAQPDDLEHIRYSNRERYLIKSELTGIVILLATIAFSILITRPLKIITKQIRNFSSGRENSFKEINYTIASEFEIISNAFLEMASIIEEREKYIERFAHESAHGFKTPLTIIKGRVEEIEDFFIENNNADQIEASRAITASIDRLTNQINLMVRLADIDMAIPSEEKNNIEELLNELIKSYTDLGISISIHYNTHVRQIAIKKEMFNEVLSNLLDNSINHGGENVEITIKVHQAYTTTGVEFVLIYFSDNGPGVSAGNRGKIFDRFFTTAKKKGGTGMGLAMARSILEKYGGDIGLEESEVGACFRILIPPTPRILLPGASKYKLSENK